MDKDKAASIEKQVEQSKRFLDGVVKLADDCGIDDDTMFSLFGLMAKQYRTEAIENGVPPAVAATLPMTHFLFGMGAKPIPIDALPPELRDQMADDDDEDAGALH